MLTADTDLDIGPNVAAERYGLSHQRADAFTIEYLEWIVVKDPLL